MCGWEVLKNKEIISILIGDTVLIDEFTLKYTLPRMSGTVINDFGEKLGYKNNLEDIKKSRAGYMNEILDYVIKEGIISIFFKELFDLKRFRNIKLEHDYRTHEELYTELTVKSMAKINECLFFDRCHIEYKMDSWKFSLVDDSMNILLESEEIKKINVEYIKRLKREIEATIIEGDFESSITKGKTLLEEVMKYGIELKDKDLVTKKDDIDTLFSKFKNLYNMHQNKEQDKRINELLGGLEKIIKSISNMRNSNSDSHGVGSKRIRIKTHHANLYGNSAVTMAEFLLSVINNDNQGKSKS